MTEKINSNFQVREGVDANRVTFLFTDTSSAYTGLGSLTLRIIGLSTQITKSASPYRFDP